MAWRVFIIRYVHHRCEQNLDDRFTPGSVFSIRYFHCRCKRSLNEIFMSRRALPIRYFLSCCKRGLNEISITGAFKSLLCLKERKWRWSTKTVGILYPWVLLLLHLLFFFLCIYFVSEPWVFFATHPPLIKSVSTDTNSERSGSLTLAVNGVLAKYLSPEVCFAFDTFILAVNGFLRNVYGLTCVYHSIRASSLWTESWRQIYARECVFHSILSLSL